MADESKPYPFDYTHEFLAAVPGGPVGGVFHWFDVRFLERVLARTYAEETAKSLVKLLNGHIELTAALKVALDLMEKLEAGDEEDVKKIEQIKNTFREVLSKTDIKTDMLKGAL